MLKCDVTLYLTYTVFFIVTGRPPKNYTRGALVLMLLLMKHADTFTQFPQFPQFPLLLTTNKNVSRYLLLHLTDNLNPNRHRGAQKLPEF